MMKEALLQFYVSRFTSHELAEAYQECAKYEKGLELSLVRIHAMAAECICERMALSFKWRHTLFARNSQALQERLGGEENRMLTSVNIAMTGNHLSYLDPVSDFFI